MLAHQAQARNIRLLAQVAAGTITDTFELALDLLDGFPRHELKRIRPRFLEQRQSANAAIRRV